MITSKPTYHFDGFYRLLKATGRELAGLNAPTASGYTPDFVPTDGQSNQTLQTYCEQYTYDALGNILELSHRDTCGGTENWKRTYEYNTNKPNNYLQKAYTGSTPPTMPQFTYDAHGNLLEMPHLNAMTWDFQDQLKTTEKTDETTYYVYSGGERVRKVCYNTATNKLKHERIYLGGYEIYRAYDASGDLALERSTNHVMDSLSRQSGNRNRIAILEVKTMDNGTAITPENQVTVARYQYSNHLGSAALELNETAEIISYQEYHPFGSTSYELHTNDSEVSLKRYQYVGKERDGESGLYYYGARYYADWLCRFVSVDPLKDDYPYYTTYQYAGNKPINFIDLDGKETEDNGQTNVDTNGQEESPPLSHPTEWSVIEGGAEDWYPDRHGLTLFEHDGQIILRQDVSTNDDLFAFEYFYLSSEDKWIRFQPGEFVGLADEITAIMMHPIKAVFENTGVDAKYTLEAGTGDAHYSRVFGFQLDEGVKLTGGFIILEANGIEAFKLYFLDDNTSIMEAVYISNPNFTADVKISKGMYAFIGSLSLGHNFSSNVSSLEIDASAKAFVFSLDSGISFDYDLLNNIYSVRFDRLNFGVELFDISKEVPLPSGPLPFQIKTFHNFSMNIKLDLFGMWNFMWNKPVDVR